MAEGQRMTAADVVAQVRDGRLEDFVKEAVVLVARELMEAEVAEQVGAGLGEVAPDSRVTHRWRQLRIPSLRPATDLVLNLRDDLDAQAAATASGEPDIAGRPLHVIAERSVGGHVDDPGGPGDGQPASVHLEDRPQPTVRFAREFYLHRNPVTLQQEHEIRAMVGLVPTCGI